MELISDGGIYGAPDFSPYTIARDLVEEKVEYEYRFDEIWAVVHMMLKYGMITSDDILDDEQGTVYYTMSASL